MADFLEGLLLLGGTKVGDLCIWEWLNVGYARAMRDCAPEMAEVVSQACGSETKGDFEARMSQVRAISAQLQREGDEYLKKKGVRRLGGSFDVDAIEEDFITNVLGREMPVEEVLDSPQPGEPTTE